MKKVKTVFNLAFVCGLWLCLAFTCNSSNRRSSSNDAPTPGRGGSGASAPDLPGTAWAFISRTKKGDSVKDVDTPPNVEFCKNGNWWIYHYGGRNNESGTYTIKGDRLIMTAEVGSFAGDFQIRRNGEMLELDDGEYVVRLKADGLSPCT